ncbi:RagB/SusD family nutrient uptake outer membrane protein [Flavicella sp.]|uniref:RagB/SusD family nutrient uptake outer membrane protein n=1 Tax=Flavicella sp. TaxID=2957742 RepID=UPI003015D592
MKIQKIFQILLAIIGLSITTACNDDFLDEDPKSFLAPENSFTNTRGFDTALTGLYIKVRDEWGWYGGGLMYAPMFVGTDVARVGWANTQITPFEEYGTKLTPTSTIVAGYWNWAYGLIGNANLVIEATENENIDWDNTSDKSRILAEARFIRAYAFRDLVTFYGAVPLVSTVAKPFRLDYTRQSVEEVLDFIIQDLEFASQNLPETTDTEGKLIQAAAQHFLAEMYLQAGENLMAENSAKLVTQNSNFSLMTERFGSTTNESGDVFSDMFKENNQNTSSGNTETIWVIQQQYNVVGGGEERFTDWSRRTWVPYYSNLTGMQLADSLGGRGLGRVQPLPSWIASYENQDIRASVHNIKTQYWYNDPSHENYGQEYPITEDLRRNGRLYESTTKFNFGVTADNPSFLSSLKDRIKIRLAETYLLLAEAQLKQGKLTEAAASINIVRNRANATSVDPGDVDIDYLLDERARELLGEFPRRITLLRTGKLLERVRAMNPASGDLIADHNVLWPIPQSAIDANSGAVLEQNPGYN